jgi:hypothetical protein
LYLTVTEPLAVVTVLLKVVGELESKSSEYVVEDPDDDEDDEPEPEPLHPAATGSRAAPAMTFRTDLRCMISPLTGLPTILAPD